MAERGPRAETPTLCGHDSHDDCDHDHHHLHEPFEVAVAPDQAAAAVEAVLRADGALRTKGFVMLGSGPALVQGVGRRIEITYPPGPVAPERMGRVVVIRRVE